MSLTSLNLSDANLLVFEAFGAGAKTYNPVGTEIFTQVTPDRIAEKWSVHAADGSIPAVADGAAFPSTNVEELGSITVNNQTYKREIPLTKRMKEYDNYGVVVEQAQRLGYGAMVQMDQTMADIMDNIEGTTTCWDGLSLANAAHLIGNTGSTQSNVTTGAFGKDNLNSCLVQLARQLNHGGIASPLSQVGITVVVPPDLRMDAYELIGSPDDPETADRSINYINRMNIRFVSWDLLTTTTDYHVVADKMFSRLRYGVWSPPAMDYVRDTNTGNYLYQVEFDCAAGAPDYLGYVFGNAA